MDCKNTNATTKIQGNPAPRILNVNVNVCNWTKCFEDIFTPSEKEPFKMYWTTELTNTGLSGEARLLCLQLSRSGVSNTSLPPANWHRTGKGTFKHKIFKNSCVPISLIYNADAAAFPHDWSCWKWKSNEMCFCVFISKKQLSFPSVVLFGWLSVCVSSCPSSDHGSFLKTPRTNFGLLSHCPLPGQDWRQCLSAVRIKESAWQAETLTHFPGANIRYEPGTCFWIWNSFASSW